MRKLSPNAGMAAWEGRMRPARSLSITLLLALLGLAIAGRPARAADDTIKIGYIDPFSGAFASGGDASLKMFQFIAKKYISEFSKRKTHQNLL